MGEKTIFSDEHKQALSKSLKGRKRTDEQRARIAEGRRKYLEKVKEALANYETSINYEKE